jgi:starch synthase
LGIDSRIRVVYVLPISWGGIPHYTAELANAVSKYADVIVLKPKDDNDTLFSRDIEVLSLFDKLNFSRKCPLSAFSLKNINNLTSFKNIQVINQMKPDIIHFTGHYPHLAIFSYFYKLDRCCPLVCTMHATFSTATVSAKNRGFSIALLNSISELSKKLIEYDRIIVHTQNNKNTLLKNGICSERVNVIPHGTYSFFKKYAKNIKKNNENTILFFGYIVDNKGIEYLLQSSSIVSKIYPDIKLIIAGEGDLSKYLKYMKNKSILEIYNKFIPNEFVAELFQRAKVVVFPYTYHQGHSGVLTIAFSFGKAIVVTNVGDLPRCINDGVNGLVVPSRDPDALARAIIKLLKDDKLRVELEINSQKEAEKLSWNNVAIMYINLYHDIINTKQNHKRKATCGMWDRHNDF